MNKVLKYSAAALSVLFVLISFSVACANDEKSINGMTNQKTSFNIVGLFEIEENSAASTTPSDNDKLATIPAMCISLDKAVEMALADHPDLKIALAQIDAADAKYRQAKSSLGIRLNVGGSYTRIDPVAEAKLSFIPNRPPTIIKLGDNNNFSGKAVLDKVITTFGQLEYAVAAAYIQIGVQRSNYEAVRQNIIFRVKEAYFTALKTEGYVKVAKDNLDISLHNLQVTKEMYSAGVVPRYEVLRAELGVSTAKQYLIAAENAAEMSKASLKNILGINQSVPLKLVEYVEVINLSADPDTAQSLAEKNRPEIQAMLMSQKAVKCLLESARRGQWPVLAFNSNYERKTVSGFNANQDLWTNTVVLSFPLFDGGKTAAQFDEQKANLQQLEQQLINLSRGIQLEVKQAVLKLNEMEARLESAAKDVETSLEGYEIAQTRYENGISTGLELDDAKKKLNEAKVNYLNVRYDYNIAYAYLEKATATSWKGETVTDEKK